MGRSGSRCSAAGILRQQIDALIEMTNSSRPIGDDEAVIEGDRFLENRRLNHQGSESHLVLDGEC